MAKMQVFDDGGLGGDDDQDKEFSFGHVEFAMTCMLMWNIKLFGYMDLKH